VHEHKLIRRVAFHETDMAGIVHFSNLFRYVEEAEAGLFRSLELGPLDRIWGAGPDGLGWVRRRAELEFLAPARLDEELEIHLWVAVINSRGLHLGARISREGRIKAQGRIETVCVRQTPAGPKARAIPKEILAVLEVAPWGAGWPETA
jgi:YbgC/YbaW family acyl-CoA thioester hydrolase